MTACLTCQASTGPSTHPHRKSKTMVFPPTRVAYDSLLKRVKALEEENKRLRNEKNETSRPPAEVELKDLKTNKARRDSWADIYKETTALHKSKRLLGQEVETDDGLEWRVKWGQRGQVVTGLLGMICYLAAQYIAAFVIGVIMLIFFGLLYYKNVSFIIAKRLLRETKVVIIILLSLANLSIDIARPVGFDSLLSGLIYPLGVTTFVFMDAIKMKSRMFVMLVGILFIFVNIINIYNLIFGDWHNGVVLLDYSIQGNKYTIMKRSTKRSIFIQVLLFSMNGIYTLFKDRKQELMIFATGHIYRETGTASREVEDQQYSMKIKSEKRILSV
eukprot:g15771.t1